jgi:hypothetical protein
MILVAMNDEDNAQTGPKATVKRELYSILKVNLNYGREAGSYTPRAS